MSDINLRVVSFMTFKNPVRFFWHINTVFGEELCVGGNGAALAFRFFRWRLYRVTLIFYADPRLREGGCANLYPIYPKCDPKEIGKAK